MYNKNNFIISKRLDELLSMFVKGISSPKLREEARNYYNMLKNIYYNMLYISNDIANNLISKYTIDLYPYKGFKNIITKNEGRDIMDMINDASHDISDEAAELYLEVNRGNDYDEF